MPSERMDRVIAMADLKRAHMNRFWKFYRTADAHHLGSISLAQFYDWLCEEQTKFADGVFELVDTPDLHIPGKQLNFDDFAAVLTTYCMFAEEEILKYCVSSASGACCCAHASKARLSQSGFKGPALLTLTSTHRRFRSPPCASPMRSYTVLPLRFGQARLHRGGGAH